MKIGYLLVLALGAYVWYHVAKVGVGDIVGEINGVLAQVETALRNG